MKPQMFERWFAIERDCGGRVYFVAGEAGAGKSRRICRTDMLRSVSTREDLR
jgi:hypothetical protein